MAVRPVAELLSPAERGVVEGNRVATSRTARVLAGLRGPTPSPVQGMAQDRVSVRTVASHEPSVHGRDEVRVAPHVGTLTLWEGPRALHRRRDIAPVGEVRAKEDTAATRERILCCYHSHTVSGIENVRARRG